jgi:HD superfamily phosphodiesterase
MTHVRRISTAHPFYLWLREQLKDRDFSHDLAHAERVRDVALRAPLPVCQGLTSEEVGQLLELAALTHDLADSKYAPTGGDKELRVRSLRQALQVLMCLGPEMSELVVLLGQSISFRRELSDDLPLESLRLYGLTGLHQRLSDADKLDALGVVGLQRLFSFHFVHERKECPSTRRELMREMRGLHQQFVAPRAHAVMEYREEAQELLESAWMFMEDIDAASPEGQIPWDPETAL